MDNRRRRRLIVSAISGSLKGIGFRHHHGDYFSRPRGPLLDAFFFQFTRSNGQFIISYGIDAPQILRSIRVNEIIGTESSTPSLWVSRSIDQLGPYGCKHDDHIANSGPKVRSDFESRACPWFETISTVEDLVEAYRASEIHLDVPSAPPPPGVELKWGIYGMMLAETADKTTASPWLDAAADAWETKSAQTDVQAEWIRIIKEAKVAL